MTAGISGTSANSGLQDFLSVASLEQQLVYLADSLVQYQAAYNTTEPIPEPLVNRVAVQPGPTGIIVQASLPLADSASTVAPYAAVEALPIGTDQLSESGTDTLTGDAATLVALTSLESQFAFVASLLEAEEGAYNTANPSDPENRVTIAPDYNNRRLAVSAVMPLAGGGLSALTGTYLP